jgi:hypothetical protein
VTRDCVLDWILDLLTTYTHDSELSNYSATALAKHSPACYVFTSRFLVKASNSEYSSASALKSSVNDGFLLTDPFLHRLPYRTDSTESEAYVTTDGRSASLSWNKASIWGLWPDFYYCQTVAVLLMWGALSEEKTGLSFTISAGPRERSHSRVRVPWDSWPYFTVSDSSLPFSSPPTTRRVTVEVFDTASTLVSLQYA